MRNEYGNLDADYHAIDMEGDTVFLGITFRNVASPRSLEQNGREQLDFKQCQKSLKSKIGFAR